MTVQMNSVVYEGSLRPVHACMIASTRASTMNAGHYGNVEYNYIYESYETMVGYYTCFIETCPSVTFV